MNNLDETKLSDGQLLYIGKENIDNKIISNEYNRTYYNKNTMVYDPQQLMNKYLLFNTQKIVRFKQMNFFLYIW